MDRTSFNELRKVYPNAYSDALICYFESSHVGGANMSRINQADIDECLFFCKWLEKKKKEYMNGFEDWLISQLKQ